MGSLMWAVLQTEHGLLQHCSCAPFLSRGLVCAIVAALTRGGMQLSLLLVCCRGPAST